MTLHLSHHGRTAMRRLLNRLVRRHTKTGCWCVCPGDTGSVSLRSPATEDNIRG